MTGSVAVTPSTVAVSVAAPGARAAKRTVTPPVIAPTRVVSDELHETTPTGADTAPRQSRRPVIVALPEKPACTCAVGDAKTMVEAHAPGAGTSHAAELSAHSAVALGESQAARARAQAAIVSRDARARLGMTRDAPGMVGVVRCTSPI